ncbi:fimbrial protein [Franconibacter helveticus 513]|uniref:fimbrial protein n=1 Tax=Franconibacter helveticus TaxID=357240 RepID=UPI0004160D13|nr:fimbrial protein [Franconibacter helveticus]MDU6926450.1 fimbrial protein [Franconibacter helveticus]
MKKTLLGLVVSSLFAVGTAQATDVAATLSVVGQVNTASSSCFVSLDNSAINLTADLVELKPQDQATVPAKIVAVSVFGNGNGCETLASQGKIAYKLKGTADAAAGTAMANTGTATGVGIGLYKEDGTVLKINQDSLVSNSLETKLGVGLVKLTGQQANSGTVHGSLTIEIERL